MIVSHLLLILHKKIQFYIFMFEAWNVARGQSSRGPNTFARHCTFINAMWYIALSSPPSTLSSCAFSNSTVNSRSFIHSATVSRQETCYPHQQSSFRFQRIFEVESLLYVELEQSIKWNAVIKPFSHQQSSQSAYEETDPKTIESKQCRSTEARKNSLERLEPRKKPGSKGWPVLFWLCPVAIIRVHGH